ncbi:MAG: hypothetical protein APZ16_05245 [Candidatus Hadarchaeum yellowstonense]|jgi:hypothetical protein|uniref:Uncharacterized protein n=1 Tax=Hadarchaeum yellowstonense TaxID=1776334 RepID=A0A147JY71_HADYE|nr:MAG: hypothetical protein APZ16_05245 [Candidatus Hadarchaeum yellowstonense]
MKFQKKKELIARGERISPIDELLNHQNTLNKKFNFSSKHFFEIELGQRHRHLNDIGGGIRRL